MSAVPIQENVRVIAASMDRVGEVLRAATAEVGRQRVIIDTYRRQDAEHEELIGKLYAMACNKEARDELLLWDEFCELVTDAYRAIHGPTD